MPARTIVAIGPRKCGDVAVSRARADRRGGDLDDCAHRRLLGSHSLFHRDMMNTAVDTVDHEDDSFAGFIGQPLADHPAGDRCRRLLAVQDAAAECPLFAALSERPVNRLDDVAARAQFAQRRFQVFRKARRAGLGLRHQAVALQGLQAADAERAVEAGADLARLGPQVE